MSISKVIKYLDKYNIIPSKKITGLNINEFIFLKWKYSKKIIFEKCPKKKEEYKIKLKEVLGI